MSNLPDLPAGPLLDAEVAILVTKVCVHPSGAQYAWTEDDGVGVRSWQRVGCRECHQPDIALCPVPAYSSNTKSGWAAMRDLVTVLCAEWAYVNIDYKGRVERWVCTLGDGLFAAPERQAIQGAAETAPHAVALAAVRSKADARLDR